MPSWCTTNIKIKHENREKLKELGTMINDWMSTNYQDNEFGHNWLGNIIGNSKLGTIKTGNKETDCEARGWVSLVELQPDCLFVQTFTAWNPMMKIWSRVMNKYLPDGELIYYAEEPDMELYCTNNKAIEGYFSAIGNSIPAEARFGTSPDELIAMLQDILCTDKNKIPTLLKILSESELADYISVHEIEQEPVENWT